MKLFEIKTKYKQNEIGALCHKKLISKNTHTKNDLSFKFFKFMEVE